MSPLAKHIETGTSTTCRAWIIRRADGMVYGFTDHDMEVTIESVACIASSGLAPGAFESSTGLSVDNAEVQGAISHDAIRDEDIRAGRWDAAMVTSYIVNWNDPKMFEVTYRGTLGEIRWGGGAFSAELRGLSAKLNKTRGMIYQKRCNAILGDRRCGIALAGAFVAEISVIKMPSNQKIVVDHLPAISPNWFERGAFHILSGEATGLSGRVKTDRIVSAGRELELWQVIRGNLKVGDRIRIEAGCDKRWKTCGGKFKNTLNFRGFPSIPGEDWLTAYPSDRKVNDGGRL